MTAENFLTENPCTLPENEIKSTGYLHTPEVHLAMVKFAKYHLADFIKTHCNDVKFSGNPLEHIK